MMIRFLSCLLLACCCAGMLLAACRLTEETLPTGAKQITLANDLVKLRFSPTLGGQCTGVVVQQAGKSYEDFTVNLFDDMDWNRMFFDQVFSSVPYTYRVLTNTPALLQVAFERQGTQDFGYIVIKKVVTLHDGDSACQVDYEVRNLPESMNQKSIKFWLHNGLYPKSLQGDYYWSTPAGVQDNPFTANGGDAWNTNPPRGWSAVVNRPASSGIACVMDYKDLASLYDWRGETAANIEWRYIPKLLHNGDSFRTTVWILPFTGLPRVDHASANGVYAWVLAPEAGQATTATLQIAPARDDVMNFTLRWRKTTAKDWQALPAATLHVTPAQPNSLPVTLPALGEGRYVLQAVVSRQNGAQDTFEKLFTIGNVEDKGEYVYAALEQKNPTLEAKHYAPFKLSEEFVTPHVSWFKPLADKKVKALCLVDWSGSRSVIELAERLSLDYTVPPLGNPGPELFFSGSLPPLGDTFSEDEKAYKDALEADLVAHHDYDVIVLQYPWNDLTTKTRDTLLSMVEQGTALMVQTRGDDGAVPEPFRKVNMQAARVDLPGGEFRRGVYSYTAPATAKTEAEPDVKPDALSEVKEGGRVCFFSGSIYSYGFCQSLLWATHREPEFKIALLDLPNKPASREEIAAGCRLRITAPQAEQGLSAECVFSQADAAKWTHVLPIADLPQGETVLNLPLPLLPVGRYECQVMLQKDGKVLNSTLQAVELTDPVTIDKITLVQNTVKSGDNVAGIVKFNNTTPQAVNRQCRCTLEDAWGREVGTQTEAIALPATGSAEAQFVFPLAHPLSVINHVVVTLLDGKNEVATKQAEVTCPELNYQDKDYLAFTWPTPGNMTPQWSENVDKLLVDYCGFNLCMSTYNGVPRSPYQQFFNFGCAWGAGYNDWQTAEGRGIRKFSMSDPANINMVMDDLTKTAKTSARYGVYGFDLADEPSLTHWEAVSNVSFDPDSLAGFAVWIKQQYPTLAALNAEWGTDFQSWDAVSPMIESEVRNRDNLAPWSDFRTWMEEVWTNFFRDARNTIKAECPQAKVGVCGVQDGHPYSGFDLWKLHDVFDFVMPYTSSAVWRAFSPAGTYGRYTGYRIAPDQQIKDNWSDFFDGQFVFSYFLATYPVPGDLSIAHTYADPIREITQRFGQGIGKQFIKSTRVNDRIAILYSQPSIHVDYMQKFREKEVPDFLAHYRASRLDFETVFHDLGYDTTYISNEQIAQGALTPAQYRMLVLPHALALSAQESAAIQQYVTAGGIVLADYLPGIYDDHGKPNATGSLDALFGVKRTQNGHDRLTYRRCPITELGKAVLLCQETGITADGAQPIFTIQAQTETPVGKFVLNEPATGGPLAYLRKVGKGAALYLDFTSDYLQNVAQSETTATMYRDMLTHVGFAGPQVTVSDANKQPVLCQVLRHQRSGEQTLLFGLLRREKLPETAPVTVTLPEPRHIYDLLTGKYLGHAASFTTPLTPGYGQLYAALPYRVTGVRLSAPATITAGQAPALRCEVLADHGTPEFHVLRLTVTAPDGSVAGYYTKNLDAPHGKCTVTLPIALNAPKGKWQVTVRDVASGMTKTLGFTIP